MPLGSVVQYIVATMALGLAGNLFDPEMTSTSMRESFLVLGIGFFAELALRGVARASHG